MYGTLHAVALQPLSLALTSKWLFSSRSRSSLSAVRAMASAESNTLSMLSSMIMDVCQLPVSDSSTRSRRPKKITSKVLLRLARLVTSTVPL